MSDIEDFDAFDEEEATEEVLTPTKMVERAAKDGFVPLMQVIERLRATSPRVGGAARPEDEPVRFRHKASLAFDFADVTKVRLRDDEGAADGRWEITTTFLGLTGSGSPLPSGMLALFRKEGEDGGATRFLDLFHHRAISLMYRAMVERDIPSEATIDGGDPWSRRLRAFAGIDPETPSPPDLQSLLRMLPVMCGPGRHSVDGMRIAVQESLTDLVDEGAEVEIEQFVPNWVELTEEDRTRLGTQNSRLGVDAEGRGGMLLGSRALDRTSKVAVHLGPVSFDRYGALREGGALHTRVADALDGLGHEGLEYDMTVRIEAGQVPGFVLGTDAPRSLGRDTWLRGHAPKETRVRFAIETN